MSNYDKLNSWVETNVINLESTKDFNVESLDELLEIFQSEENKPLAHTVFNCLKDLQGEEQMHRLSGIAPIGYKPGVTNYTDYRIGCVNAKVVDKLESATVFTVTLIQPGYYVYNITLIVNKDKTLRSINHRMLTTFVSNYIQPNMFVTNSKGHVLDDILEYKNKVDTKQKIDPTFDKVKPNDKENIWFT